MTSILNDGFDVMNCFAKLGKFLPHSIIIKALCLSGVIYARVITGGGAFCPPYKIGSQNTPYKLGLTLFRLGVAPTGFCLAVPKRFIVG